MQKRRPVEEVLADLRTWQRTCGISYDDISQVAEVNLSTVYRLFNENEQRARYGSALKKICKIAKISIDDPLHLTQVPPVVRDAVLQTWDGTAEHARLLAAAISAVGELIRQAVSSK